MSCMPRRRGFVIRDRHCPVGRPRELEPGATGVVAVSREQPIRSVEARRRRGTSAAGNGSSRPSIVQAFHVRVRVEERGADFSSHSSSVRHRARSEIAWMKFFIVSVATTRRLSPIV